MKRKDIKLSGVGIIELVLILAVLIALVVIFRDELTNLLTSAFSQIDSDARDIIS